MNDPIDGFVAAGMATKIPASVSGVLIIRFTTRKVCCLTVLAGCGPTFEVYGLQDELAMKLAPHMTRCTYGKGARAGQPYWVGRGTVTVDPSLAGMEATPDEYGVTEIKAVDVNPQPRAKACGDEVAAAFGL